MRYAVPLDVHLSKEQLEYVLEMILAETAYGMSNIVTKNKLIPQYETNRKQPRHVVINDQTRLYREDQINYWVCDLPRPNYF